MESQVLDEQVAWEARRVAAAFGVVELETTAAEFDDELPVFSSCAEDGTRIAWSWSGLPLSFQTLCIESYGAAFWRSAGEEQWRWPLTLELPPKLVARGYYRLGVDEDALAELNYTLSNHEKMELRLSMPREFWPKEWLTEEAR